jgi:pimeloyl-ACP methyl ester carboxylesterase
VNLANRIFEGPAGASTLLLLHGVTRDGSDWEPVLQELRRDWRVIAVDHCGHGDSPRTPGEYLVADYARHTADFVRANLAQAVTVLGHSLGAMVGLALAAECPAHVAAIALEDPPFHTMGRDISATPYQAQFAGMHEVARRGGTIEAMTDALAEIRLSPTTRLGDVRDRAALRFSAECLQRLDPEVLVPLAAGRWLDGFVPEALWPRVRCPVLLLQGDAAAGGAFSDSDVALAKSAVPLAMHVRFHGVGHQIHRTRPAEVVGILREFASANLLHSASMGVLPIQQ